MKTLSTKRALFASVLSLLLCVTMLVGSTFAWFTDTATASVNSIKAGTLDVSLEMLDNDGNWVSAEGKTLQFLVAGKIPEDGTEILWEPGCTYSLPKLRVTNDGNLALKYKVVITGIQGDAELNDVIDWTIGDAAVGENKSLAPQASAEFTITGRMQATAGNAYQGKTIDGIAVSVYATQDTAEKDSNGSTYDAGADMTPDNLDQLLVNGVAVSDLTSALKAATDGSTITFRKSTTEPLQLNLTELTELKGVTFEAAPGVEVKGMKLISEERQKCNNTFVLRRQTVGRVQKERAFCPLFLHILRSTDGGESVFFDECRGFGFVLCISCYGMRVTAEGDVSAAEGGVPFRNFKGRKKKVLRFGRGVDL